MTSDPPSESDRYHRFFTVVLISPAGGTLDWISTPSPARCCGSSARGLSAGAAAGGCAFDFVTPWLALRDAASARRCACCARYACLAGALGGHRELAGVHGR